MFSFGSTRSALVPRAYLSALNCGPVVQAVHQAIAEAHPTRQWRCRRLPPSLIVWFNLAMGLWRHISQEEVFRHLCEAWGRMSSVAADALAHARERLGPEPLGRLFQWTGVRSTPEPSFRGFRVYIIDGVHLDVPDTRANARAYGRPGSPSACRPFPQLLVVTLVAAFTRCVRSAVILPGRSAERPPALRLLDLLGPTDLVLLDAGFYSVWLVRELERRRLRYVVRLPASVKNLTRSSRGLPWFVIETFHRPERRVRGRRRRGPGELIRVQGRVIRYRIGRERVRLLTNLGGVGAEEIVRVYRQRWETEIANDEIKTHLAAPAKGAAPIPIRSKSPPLVEQEIYAYLALYNLMRQQMALAAGREALSPAALSFVACANVIRRACLRPVPAELADVVRAWTRVLDELGECLLDRPRRPRRGPRVVRKPRSPYPGKRPRHRSRPFHFETSLRIREGT